MVADVATQTVVVVGMMPVVVVMDMLKVSVIVEEVVAAVLEWTAVAEIVLVAVLVGAPGTTAWDDVAEVVAVSEDEARLMPATVVVTVGPLPGPCESLPSFPAAHSPK